MKYVDDTPKRVISLYNDELPSYVIVKRKTLKELSEAVNNYIKYLGYAPVGGIAKTDGYYIQGVIKDEDDYLFLEDDYDYDTEYYFSEDEEDYPMEDY